MIFIPSRMGLLNRRALLRRLQEMGAASRADLARSLGMSQPTVGKIVDDLMRKKVIEEVAGPLCPGESAEGVALRGRPGRMLRLNRNGPEILAIQLGIQETSLAVLPVGEQASERWDCQFRLAPDEVRPAWAWSKGLEQSAKKLRSRKITGAILSVPGIVDEHRNRILFSPNIHWSEKTDMAALVRNTWNVPVKMIQEERALALGHLLAMPIADDFLLVDFGEGVGGAIIVNGRPMANSLPISGEIGHTPVMGNRRKCGCGATGCMETLVSLRGLLKSFSVSQKRKNVTWPGLKEHVSRNGVPVWLAQSLEAAATAIAGALNVLGLRRVVITGLLAELPPAAITHLAKAVQNGSLWAKFGSVECLAVPRRRTVGLVAMGIDLFIVPDPRERPVFTGGKSPVIRGRRNN